MSLVALAVLALAVGSPAAAEKLARQYSAGPDGLFTTTTSAVVSNGSGNFAVGESDIPREASIIVPAYKEEANIRSLCERVFLATRKANIEAEMIIVDDDSNDGTVETVNELHQNQGYDISVHVRKGVKGLSTAVLAGLDRAQKPVMLVMDADLQHPPEYVPHLLEPIFNGSATFVLGSRNVPGGGVSKDWSFLRRAISHGATMLALPLVSVSDPMSGFFAIHRSAYNAAHNLNPFGFKIALELIVKSENLTAVEVPFTFVSRTYGQSKLKLKTQVQYLQHLVALYWYKYPVSILLLLALAMTGVVCALLALSAVQWRRAERVPQLPRKSRKAY